MRLRETRTLWPELSMGWGLPFRRNGTKCKNIARARINEVQMSLDRSRPHRMI
jgi:hypothetical protein